MAHWLFSVLLIVNAFCMAIGNPIASTSYRFEVYPVDKCPINKSEFKEAAIRKNCSQNTRYLCAPDRNLSSLIEFCTDVSKSLYGPDNCVRLEGRGNLNHFNCVGFSSGCPSTPYNDDEIYKYPACLSINRDLNCFIADTNCRERLFTTTTLDMGLNNSTSEHSTSKMETNSPEPHSNTNKIIISVVCVVVMIAVVIGIIGFAFYKRLCKNTGITTMQVDEKKINDFLSKEDFTVRHVRFILVGCGGAGKTTLLKRLQNAKFKDLKNIETTEIVDVHVNIFDVLENENTIQGVINEKKIPLITFPPNVSKKNDTMPQLDETPFTAEQLTKENDQCESGHIEISESESVIDDFESMDERGYDETDSLSGAETKIKLIQLAPRNTPLNGEDKRYQILKEKKTNSYTKPFSAESAKSAFSKILNAVKELSSDDHLCPRITFLDFAGQSMYYAFQQIYFSAKTCYILVVDMTKKPNEQVHETGDRCCSLFESWTYKDYYKFWLKLIDSYSDIDSPVILVGTHAENLSEQDGVKFFKEFKALFKDHPDILRHLNVERNFAIRFPKKGSKLADLEDIKTCIAKIVNLQGYSDQIKPVWALFEHIMQKEKKRRIIERKILSDFNDELGEEYRLNDENITEMLLFMHRVGNLLYFDEGILKETLILDVQWFVNAFRSIIEYHENIACADHNSSRFKTTGEITDQELTTIWESKKEGQSYISHKKEILRYMEHFGLVATCNAQNGLLPFYYFPSMNNKKFTNPSNDFIKSSILCFQFNTDRQLPFNIFYRLVVKCLKNPEWAILQEENEQNCLYENVACFSYQHYIVVVCLCKFQIQLQVWNAERNGNIDKELLGNIQRSVEETFSGREYLYKIGYKCMNGKLNAEEDDSFIAQKRFPVSRLYCPNCTLGNKHIVDNEICWVHPGQPGYTSTSVPINIVNDIGGEGEGVPINIVNDIGGEGEDVPEEDPDRDKQRVQRPEIGNPLDNINACDEKGKTALYIACEFGNFNTVEYLLSNGADVNLCDSSGASPFLISVLRDHLNVSKLLLDNGADINLCFKPKGSILHLIAILGKDNILQFLLNSDANINLLNSDGESPLFLACQEGHSSTVRLLIDNGADINLCPNNKVSPLLIACRGGNEKTVNILLNNGANINQGDIAEVSPLYIACQQGHIQVVELLLSKGAEINACIDDGTSPLFIACQEEYEDIVKLLLDNGANIDLCRKDGISPLAVACANGNDSIVQNLLRKGANINIRNTTGMSPLLKACSNGKETIVKLLLDNGADINDCSVQKSSALFWASQEGHVGVVQCLLSNGADINLCTTDGKSPLLVACFNGHANVVQHLLKYGADINLCTSEGYSPLYIASYKRYDRIMQLLIKAQTK